MIAIGVLVLPISTFFYKKDSLFVRLFLAVPIGLFSIGLISWVMFLMIGNSNISFLVSLIFHAFLFSYSVGINRQIYLSNFEQSIKVLRKQPYHVKTFLIRVKKLEHTNDFIKFSLIIIFLNLFFIFLRGLNGDLVGTEKLMDHMMLSSVYWADQGIVPDLWFSGHENPYYIFGYWIYGGLFNLLNINVSVGYNFAIATTFTLSATSISCMAFKVFGTEVMSSARKIAISFTSIISLLFVTNYSIFWEIISKFTPWKIFIFNLANIKGIGESTVINIFGGSGWRSTRVIDFVRDSKSLDYTIQEYPAFSFLLGDLHPHVLSIPFLILLSVLIIQGTLNIRNKIYSTSNIFKSILIGTLIPVAGFLNIWDLPFLLFLLTVSTVVGYLQLETSRKDYVKIALYNVFGIALGFLVLSKYYFSTLGGQANSPFISFNNFSTNPIHMLTVFGLFIFIVYIQLFREISSKKRLIISPLIISITVVAVIFIFRGTLNYIYGNDLYISNYVYGALTSIILLLPIMLIIKNKIYKDYSSRFFTILILVSFSMLFIVEHLHLVDLFGNRMNTVFKSYYQVWILFSLLTPLVLVKIWINGNKTQHWIMLILLPTTLILSGVQNYSTLVDTTNNFGKKFELNSNAYLDQIYPGSSDVIIWVNENTHLSDIIFTGIGRDYENTSFLSVLTGRQTPLGWLGHERQWRAGSKEIEIRRKDLEKIQISQALEDIQLIIEKYDIAYIIDYRGHELKNSRLQEIYLPVYSSGVYSIYKTRIE